MRELEDTEVAEFALRTGMVMDYLYHDAIKASLMDRGVSAEDIKAAQDGLGRVAQAFYSRD